MPPNLFESLHHLITTPPCCASLKAGHGEFICLILQHQTPEGENVSGRRLYLFQPLRLVFRRPDFIIINSGGFFFFFVLPPQLTFCLFIAAVWFCCCRPVGSGSCDWTGSVVLTSGCLNLPQEKPVNLNELLSPPFN